ncbi:MAG: YraN family protein [Flavobacteriales bacterium]|nr:YraN family protein [Flavobacteriales bacterium]
MSVSYDFGKKAEEDAKNYLLKNGYVILEQNFTYQKAEIDIIARKDDVLCIIEVKARSYNSVLEPYEAVNEKKKKLLILATDYYIQKNDLDVEVRFDIISIIENKYKSSLEHIEDAFSVI